MGQGREVLKHEMSAIGSEAPRRTEHALQQNSGLFAV
jgi:hypothetical protein